MTFVVVTFPFISKERNGKLCATRNSTSDANASASVRSSELRGRLRSNPPQRRQRAVAPSGISPRRWSRSQSWQATRGMAGLLRRASVRDLASATMRDSTALGEQPRSPPRSGRANTTSAGATGEPDGQGGEGAGGGSRQSREANRRAERQGSSGAREEARPRPRRHLRGAPLPRVQDPAQGGGLQRGDRGGGARLLEARPPGRRRAPDQRSARRAGEGAPLPRHRLPRHAR